MNDVVQLYFSLGFLPGASTMSLVIILLILTVKPERKYASATKTANT